METITLKPQYDYFLRIRETLLPDKENKFIVIVGESVVGVFNSLADAMHDASQHYAAGTFLIQKVFRTKEDRVQKYASQVVCFHC